MPNPRGQVLLALLAVAVGAAPEDRWQEQESPSSDQLMEWTGQNRANWIKGMLGITGGAGDAHTNDPAAPGGATASSLSWENIRQRAKRVQLKLSCRPTSLRSAGVAQSALQHEGLMALDVFSTKGQSSTVYTLDDKWLLKLPISDSTSNEFRSEYRATEMMVEIGLNVPETFFCRATDADGGNEMNALVKAMLKGWDLSDVMVALSTTGMCKQKGGCSQPCSDFGCEPHITPNGMCLHPGCPIEHSGEDKSQIEMSADEYNKFKRMGGSRWSSFWKQRGGSGGNRRTDLGVAVRTALECAYEKLAVDNIAMQSTPHWRYFGDLKPDNFRWATAPGDSAEKLYVMDTTLFEYDAVDPNADEYKERKPQFFDSWKQVHMSWAGMLDATAPDQCSGPHWSKFSPQRYPKDAKALFKDSCHK